MLNDPGRVTNAHIAHSICSALLPFPSYSGNSRKKIVLSMYDMGPKGAEKLESLPPTLLCQWNHIFSSLFGKVPCSVADHGRVPTVHVARYAPTLPLLGHTCEVKHVTLSRRMVGHLRRNTNLSSRYLLVQGNIRNVHACAASMRWKPNVQPIIAPRLPIDNSFFHLSLSAI